MTTDHTHAMPAVLTTAKAAEVLNRKPNTLRRWAFTGAGPIKPIKINGRLAWPADAIALLLRGGV